MVAYFALARMSFRRQFTYRAAMLSGLATNVFFGLLRVAVVIALYAGRQETAGITLAQAVAFSGVTQAIIVYLSLFGWFELTDQVRSGEIGAELLRPIDVFGAWLARDVGRALAGLIMRGLPVVLLYVYFFDLKLPASIGQWAGFALAMALALWVSFGWRFLINLISFWTADARGFGRPLFGAAYVLSGFLLPLRFYPPWLQALCALTPFPATVTTPVEAFLGIGSSAELALALATQLAWASALTALCLFVLSRGMRKLVVQGG
jgi:ABC-2 type transport system permease protein